MHWVDIAIVLIIGASTLVGFVRGIILEVFSFGSIFLGTMVAFKFHITITPYFEGIVGNVAVAKGVSFVFILLVVTLGVVWMGRRLSTLSKKSGLNSVDRSGGALFGFMRGVVVVFILVLLGTTLFQKTNRVLAESMLGSTALSLTNSLINALPDSVKDKVESKRLILENGVARLAGNEKGK